ncbi:hypothetical protein [Hyphomicrobium sp. 802]|uniref:hypothetical protein n=2 Tax=Hyphomicrobium TaxID=81 RepID=UPI00045E7978|nr:hypothetical protein [Hyphomicrobium sp. 802]
MTAAFMMNSSAQAEKGGHAAAQLKCSCKDFTRVAMDKYRVVVWCESCRGDDEGCFGGSSEVIGAQFETWEEAEKAGAHYCFDLPYRYRVEQADMH